MRRAAADPRSGPPTQWAAHYAGTRARYRQDQALTSAGAARHGAPWTEEEDRYLLEHGEQSARAVGLALGRTMAAVSGRRAGLARRKRKDTPT